MTTAPNPAVEARIDQLHAHGMVDMHFDMLMDLYDKRARTGVLEADYLPDLEHGGVGILGAAIYIEDKYLPEQALRVALAQVARLYTEVDQTARFAICRSHAAIVAARAAGWSTPTPCWSARTPRTARSTATSTRSSTWSS